MARAVKKDTGRSEDAGSTAPSDTPVADSGDVSGDAEKTDVGMSPTEEVTVTGEQLTEAINRGLEKWRARHCHDTPLGKSTPALNYVRSIALPELPALIIKEIK